MKFIETSIFTKLVHQYFSDDEYLGLQLFIVRYPKSGSIVRGTSGVRKLRWQSKGRGKRGGVRVIYFVKTNQDEIWLLTIYGKNVKENIPPKVLKRLQRKSKMSERDIGLEILEGIQEINNFRVGKNALKTRKLSMPSDPKSIRKQLGLSQAAFAGLMGVSLRTIQDWEQGRRKPSGPARSLLRIAEQHPNVFLEVV